jgi:hypothetical protein
VDRRAFLLSAAAAGAAVLAPEYATVHAQPPAGYDRPAPLMDLSYFLARMRSVEHLPELDNSHTAMSSTWDRSGGNADGTDYKRVEGTRNILLDVDGPGCIHRIFTGTLGKAVEGTRIQIVLDHGPKPVFDLPVDTFLDDKNGPLPYPLVFHKTYPGALFPIPFARHCTVTLVNDQGKNWGDFWQITWTRYDESAGARTFSWPLSDTERAEVARTVSTWLEAESKPPRIQPSVERVLRIKPGQADEIRLQGCGVVRQLRVAMDPATPDALRGVRILCFWDGACDASVDAPIGYIFGHGDIGLAKGTAYNSLMLGVTETEAYSCFPMPYANGATMRFENRSSAETVEVRVRLEVEGRASLPESWGRFHATWTEKAANGSDAPKYQGRCVHSVLDRSSVRGKYVGVMLQVHWFSSSWWGEGDWLVWSDEDGWPPSYHGTGSEEYFNSGWCLFDRKAVSGFVKVHPGDVAVYSFHLNDAFQFRRSIRVAEETWVPGHPVWGSTAFWYALPAQAAGSRPDLGLPRPRRRVMRIDGATEGEALRVVSAVGHAAPFEMTPFNPELWSGGSILWWRGARPGDRLILGFDAPARGRYRIAAYLARSWDYGIHQLRVNDVGAGDPIDLWSKSVVPMGPIDLGFFDLEAHDNRLTVDVVGTNPQARPANYMFGLDAIVLSPVTPPGG